jgi:hypothetical protein
MASATSGIAREHLLKLLPVIDVGMLLAGQCAAAREFSSGSVGYYVNGKASVTVKVDGHDVIVPLQIGCNVTVIGSKPAAK